MLKLREVYLLCENLGVLRQVSRFVRQETGIREVDFYEAFCRAALADREPVADRRHSCSSKVPSLMVPPVSWRLFIDEVRAYLIEELGLPADAALETVLAVQHGLLPGAEPVLPLRARAGPRLRRLARGHHRCQGRRSTARTGRRSCRGCATSRRASSSIDDPKQVCTLNIGSSVDGDAYSDWELRSPVARSMPAAHGRVARLLATTCGSLRLAREPAQLRRRPAR